MDGADDVLIEFGIISNKSHAFAVPFRDKEGRRAPVSRFIALNDYAKSYILGYL